MTNKEQGATMTQDQKTLTARDAGSLGGAIEEKLAYNATRADHKPEARNASGGKSY